MKNAENTSSTSAASNHEAPVQYGEPTPARWYDEGNVSFDAWSVTVVFAETQREAAWTRTYWFLTEHGARVFVEGRKAG